MESEVKYKKGTREMNRIKAGVHFFCGRWGHPHVLHSFPCLSPSLFSPSAFVSLIGLFILKCPPPPFPRHLSKTSFLNNFQTHAFCVSPSRCISFYVSQSSSLSKHLCLSVSTVSHWLPHPLFFPFSSLSLSFSPHSKQMHLELPLASGLHIHE